MMDTARRSTARRGRSRRIGLTSVRKLGDRLSCYHQTVAITGSAPLISDMHRGVQVHAVIRPNSLIGTGMGQHAQALSSLADLAPRPRSHWVNSVASAR